jgi:hypothetical protein
MKAEFKLFDRVKFVNLPVNCPFHNGEGFIAGKSVSSAEMDCYIVWLDIPTDTHLAVSITEACLELDNE